MVNNKETKFQKLVHAVAIIFCKNLFMQSQLYFAKKIISGTDLFCVETPTRPRRVMPFQERGSSPPQFSGEDVPPRKLIKIQPLCPNIKVEGCEGLSINY